MSLCSLSFVFFCLPYTSSLLNSCVCVFYFCSVLLTEHTIFFSLAYMARSIAHTTALHVCVSFISSTVFFSYRQIVFSLKSTVYIYIVFISIFVYCCFSLHSLLFFLLLVGLIVDFVALLHYSLELFQLLLVVVCVCVSVWFASLMFCCFFFFK